MAEHLHAYDIVAFRIRAIYNRKWQEIQIAYETISALVRLQKFLRREKHKKIERFHKYDKNIWFINDHQ